MPKDIYEMNANRQISCENCAFNALQHDTVGSAIGYCSLHKKSLRASRFTTCGSLLRKDLDFESNESVTIWHKKHFDSLTVHLLVPGSNKEEFASSNLDRIARDVVGKHLVVPNTDERSKIGSIVELRKGRTIRSDFAYLSTSRTYVQFCESNSKNWTSGIHLFRWTSQRILHKKDVLLSDLRSSAYDTEKRQIEMIHLDLILTRLKLISDIGYLAKKHNDDAGRLADIYDLACAALDTSKLEKLEKWIKSTGLKLIARSLPQSRLVALGKAVEHQRGAI